MKMVDANPARLEEMSLLKQYWSIEGLSNVRDFVVEDLHEEGLVVDDVTHVNITVHINRTKWEKVRHVIV